jgi:hypothetical protein
VRVRLNQSGGVSIDDCFNEIGGFGRYQKLLMVMGMMSMSCGSYILYNVSYFEL